MPIRRQIYSEDDVIGTRPVRVPSPPVDPNALDLFAPSPKAVGIQRADDHASTRWKALATQCVRICADTLPDFTSDDIWAALAHSTKDIIEGERNPSALGPVMLAMARTGYITKTGTVRPSKRPAQHGQEIRVWRKA